MMKRLFTLLVVSLALVCLNPLEVFAPPSIPTPNGPGGGGFTPIDGALSVLMISGVVTILIARKKIK